MTATETSSPEWTHCYRLRPSVRNIGFAGIVFGTLMGTSSTVIAWFNVDDSFSNPVLAAILFAVVWSALVLLGATLVLLFYRYRLFVNESMILQVGAFRRQHAELSRVDRLTWCKFPQGGSARLFGVFGRLKIDFGSIDAAQREHLVDFLRRSIDQTKQQHWDDFCEQFADSPARRQRASRSLTRFGLLFLAIAIAFLGTWLAGLGGKLLVAAIVNAVFGAFMLWSGRRAARPSLPDVDNVPAVTSEESLPQS